MLWGPCSPVPLTPPWTMFILFSCCQIPSLLPFGFQTLLAHPCVACSTPPYHLSSSLSHRYSFSSSSPFLSCRTSEQAVEQEVFCKWQFGLLATAWGWHWKTTKLCAQQCSPSLAQHSTSGWDTPQWLPVQSDWWKSVVSRHLFSPLWCSRARVCLRRTCHACCMPLPFALGAKGLNHVAVPDFLCFPLWESLSLLAIFCPPSLCSWGWVVDTAWWEA